MKLTARDHAVLRDLAYSHVLSRDHLLSLGYFSSVTRANTRLRALRAEGLVRTLDTPFFAQSLHAVGRKAAVLFPTELARLVQNRAPSPRFLRHALAVTDVRTALTKRSGAGWKFEQELWRKVDGEEVRPDGLVLSPVPVFVEVDLGHVSSGKFASKLASYRTLAASTACQRLYGFPRFRLLVVTTGRSRADRLTRLFPPDAGFDLLVETFQSIGVSPLRPWS